MSMKEGVRRHWVVLLAGGVFLVSSIFQALTHTIGDVPDENYHLSAIRQYAQQWSPIISHQGNLTATGDLTRNPSYLYHYLLSFPYRALTSLGLGPNTAWRVTCLLTVVLGLLSIWLLYRLLHRVTNFRLAQQATAIYALLPITSIVFAGPNYDNLLLPLAFLILYLVLEVMQRFSFNKALLTLALIIAGCLVKFAFCPIAVILVPVVIYQMYQHRKELLKHELPQDRLPALSFICCALLLIGALGLGYERYGRNVVRYGNPQPSCQTVQPRNQCLLYAVNRRNDSFTTANKGKARKNITIYAANDWYRNMVRGLVYPSPQLKFRLVIMGYTGLAVLALALCRRFGYQDQGAGILLLSVAGLYLLSVFLDNYLTYVKLGEPFAINGRYLLPALPFVLVSAQASVYAWLPKRAWQVFAGLGLASLLVAQLFILKNL